MMNEPPRLNEWRMTSRIGMNRNVRTSTAQMRHDDLGAVALAAVRLRRVDRRDGGASTGATVVM